MVDIIPFEENLFQHRNKVRIAKAPGERFLTVPLLWLKKGELICNMEIDNTKSWREEHWNLILSSYEKAPYFKTYAPFFEDVYRREWTMLVDLNEFMLKEILNFFGIKTELLLASRLGINVDEKDIHVQICKKVGATRYMSGKGVCDYLDKKTLATAGIEHLIQQFIHPTYPQIHGGFVGHMAAIDLLFNCGPESIQYLKYE